MDFDAAHTLFEEIMNSPRLWAEVARADEEYIVEVYDLYGEFESTSFAETPALQEWLSAELAKVDLDLVYASDRRASWGKSVLDNFELLVMADMTEREGSTDEAPLFRTCYYVGSPEDLHAGTRAYSFPGDDNFFLTPSSAYLWAADNVDRIKSEFATEPEPVKGV